MPNLEWKWERIAMDFMVDLPKTLGNWRCETFGADLVKDAQDKVRNIQAKLLAAQSRQKRYADRKVSDMAFQNGEQVLLKVSPMKGMIRFGGVIVHNGSESSFVSDVKAKQYLDLILVDLKPRTVKVPVVLHLGWGSASSGLRTLLHPVIKTTARGGLRGLRPDLGLVLPSLHEHPHGLWGGPRPVKGPVVYFFWVGVEPRAGRWTMVPFTVREPFRGSLIFYIFHFFSPAKSKSDSEVLQY
ncbi:hypothetical protein MTR67_044131 [Solanum verrucosum]|uniref:Uncharacterized protein n=1 Tax=Solanum verrucosum TaxID=315347 RepID=A0AAF0ZTB4_SOLVR|nr:hypothetical protein MTR67_044131 [Solanum verrucosum]